LNTDVSSANPQLVQQQTLEELDITCLQSHKDPDSLIAMLEEWLAIEDMTG